MPNSRLRIHPCETAALAAATRASWIGTLQLNDFSVPVKAYSAIASPESHLHLIHAACGRRVWLRKICPEHGMLESSEIQKAFAYSPDLLVALSDDELAQLSPVDDKTIVMERFFSPEQFDLALLAGRTLFLVPASLAAQQAFCLLKAALDQQAVWALGRTVFSQRRQLVVIHSRDDTLLLQTLHDPALRRTSVPCPPNGHPPSRSEVRKLATAMKVDGGEPIPWRDYRDDFHERLAALVAGKVAAQGASRYGKKTTTRSTERSRARTAAKAA